MGRIVIKTDQYLAKGGLSMLGTLHNVKKGDTLWDLSKSYLDDPMRWPEIYHHNNQPEVVAKTGLRIVDPDLIFVKQKIYIPKERVDVPALVGKTGKVKAKTKFQSVPFQYDFDAVPLIVVVSPTHVATVSLIGSVTIQSVKKYDILAIQRNGLTSAAKLEADTIFGKLVADVKVGWNEGLKNAKFEIGLTLKSKSPFAPEISVSAGKSSVIPGLPVMKVSMKTLPINQPSGNIAGHYYTTSNFGVEMEIFPKQGNSVKSFVGEPVQIGVPQQIHKATPIPQNSHKATPTPNNSTNRKIYNQSWTYLSPDLIKTAAYIIIAATIVEDVITLGVGVADDVATFALAAAMLRAAASRPVVNAVVKTGARVMVSGGRTVAGATVGAAALAN